MAGMESADLVVIGAGWHGLAAAKTFLQVNPSARVIIFESAPTLGGVWSIERIYPTLKTNSVLGAYEYGDFPMDTETYGVEPGQHIPGEVVHRYLTNYAEKFDVYKRIRFNTKVESAEHKEGGGWILATAAKNHISAAKLILATGLTSEPILPNIAGSETFGAPLFHNKSFRQFATTLDTSQTVCVLGGTKSAWDVVYAYASAGHKVDWIIRASGHGPAWMSPTYVTPLKRLLEGLVLTRFLAWFSPCIWGQADGYSKIRSFLHGSAIGRFLVKTFWGILGSDVLTSNNYDAHPETAKLKPWLNIFFVGTGLSILNHDTDIFEFVRNGTVQVHVADITSLSPGSVNLSNGESLPTGALVCCTGWKHLPPLKFLPAGQDLGMGKVLESLDSATSAKVDLVDEQLFAQFPSLKDQPVSNSELKSSHDIASTAENDPAYQLALYRFMVPPNMIEHRDIAVTGGMRCIGTVICAQVQALWITAYLTGQLPITANVEHETLLHSRFAKWRTAGGFGDHFPDLAFDSMPYFDMLMRDLGLKQQRKQGLLADIFDPHMPADYKTIVEEWLALPANNSAV